MPATAASYWVLGGPFLIQVHTPASEVRKYVYSKNDGLSKEAAGKAGSVFVRYCPVDNRTLVDLRTVFRF